MLGLHFNNSIQSVSTMIRYNQSLGIDTFQTFVSDPKKFNSPIDFTHIAMLGSHIEEPKIIVHGPFGTNLTKNRYHQQFILGYVEQVIKTMITYPSNFKFYLVLHPGNLGENQNYDQARGIMCEMFTKMLTLTEMSNISICFETMANRHSLGEYKFLTNTIAYFNNPRIRLCLDTEHIVASGLDLSNLAHISLMSPFVEVVHLNAIPTNVIAGSHKDSHSTISISEGQCLNQIYDIYTMFKEKPMVSECLENYALDNIKWLSSYEPSKEYIPCRKE